MSGHSKWSNIKHRKAAQDAVRGKIFTRLGKELTVAVKEGGPDPNVNIKLKAIILKAKKENMPNDTIEKAIKKASSDKDSINYEAITYEGYGPNGIAVIVETLTDNRNRTAANVRHAFTKIDSSLGTAGCVSFMFDRKGYILIEKTEDFSDDDIMLTALEAGAEDFKAEDEGYEIITDPNDFDKVVKALEEKNIICLESEVKMLPQTYVDMDDEDGVKKMEKLLNLLEEDDDVQNIWHNWNI